MIWCVLTFAAGFIAGPIALIATILLLPSKYEGPLTAYWRRQHADRMARHLN